MARESEERTAESLIYPNTSAWLHLQNQSHPLLIDVWIIELSPWFPCSSSSLDQTLVIVFCFTWTPFTTKDILACVYVNIIPDCCQCDREAPRRPWLITGLSRLINLRSQAWHCPGRSAWQLVHPGSSQPPGLSLPRQQDVACTVQLKQYHSISANSVLAIDVLLIIKAGYAEASRSLWGGKKKNQKG